jgi:diguanylate cyclase (GGDEF)-like protein
MNIYLWLVYILVAIVSLLPLVRIDLFSVSNKYRYFKYLSIFLFVWSLITGLKFVIYDAYILYYILLSVYPLVYLLTITIFLAMMRFLGKNLSKYFVWLLIAFFFVDLAFAYTNSLHNLMIDITFNTNLTYLEISTAPPGLFFYIHTAICYILLVVTMVYIVKRLYGGLKEERDVFPFTIMIISILVGIGANVIHVFFYQFIIDPTYLAFVLFTSVLYFIFYIRDLKLILKLNNNEFILDNLREMYVIVNQKNMVVDASKELLSKFAINHDISMSFDELKERMSSKAVVYFDKDNLDKLYQPDKMYLHMLEKPINLPFFKYSGRFYLFYDETQNQKYINDMDYVMNHDLMTNLYNRNYFESIRYEIEKNFELYSLIMFDIDGLKLYNDFLGHKAGDELLVNFSKALEEVGRQCQDCIAIRMGGDEFLVILKEKTKEQAQEMVNKIITLTEDKDLVKNLGFSYGIAQKETKRDSFSKVLFEADALQYEMKAKRSEIKKKLEEHLASKNK